MSGEEDNGAAQAQVQNAPVDINTVLQSILDRLAAIETKQGALDAPDSSQGASSGQASGHPSPTPETDTSVGASRDIQGEFAAIRDSLQRVKLPSDIRLNDSNKQGVRRQDHPTANILIKCARYIETLFKILSQCSIESSQAPQDLKESLDTLFTVCLANIRYIQEEYASIIVQGTFDHVTTKMFKSLQKNNSVFSPQQVEILQNAASISAAASHHTSDRESFDYSRRRPFVQRGRGLDRRSSFSRGSNHYNTWNSPGYNDPFAQLASRNISSAPRQNWNRDPRTDNSGSS